MATPEASGSGGNDEGCDPSVTYYRLEEVAKRNSAEETWMVIHGRVYDITRFLSEVRVWEAGGRGRGEGWGATRRRRAPGRDRDPLEGSPGRRAQPRAAWSTCSLREHVPEHRPVFQQETLRLAESENSRGHTERPNHLEPIQNGP